MGLLAMFGSTALAWVTDVVTAVTGILAVATEPPIVYFVYLAIAGITLSIAVRLIKGA